MKKAPLTLIKCAAFALVLASIWWALSTLPAQKESLQPPRPGQIAHVTAPQQELTPREEKPDVEQTRGNFTFIELNIWLSGADSVNSKCDEILKALAKFEANHPELEIVTFQVLAQEPDYYPGRIGGIWIHHRPRPATQNCPPTVEAPHGLRHGPQ